jgi:ribosomal protein S18 acetylase RimI-like enzyme
MITVRPHTPGDQADQALEGLFTALYAHLDKLGLGTPLVHDGARLWLQAITPMLGKLTFVHLAWEDTHACGFVAGTLRTLPAHLGGRRVGALTHIHVTEAQRGRGIGRQLHDALQESFRAKGVDLMETDALVHNAASRVFFAGVGFREDHVILRKPLS